MFVPAGCSLGETAMFALLMAPLRENETGRKTCSSPTMDLKKSTA